VGGGTAISWFDWAKMIVRQAGLEPQLLPATARSYRTAARRPQYSALSNAKMESCGLAPMPPLDASLEQYFSLRTQS
jgi:dTDP-4-dehydrorhamnose reductase